MARTRERTTIGWREWVRLPQLGDVTVKAKVDTGARTSAIHATHVRDVDRGDGRHWVSFHLHPLQRSTRDTVEVLAPVVDERTVTSSSGHGQDRLVVVTEVDLAGQRWPIEVTLTHRENLGFRMLLGRAAIRDRFVVDPGRSYLTGRPPKEAL